MLNYGRANKAHLNLSWQDTKKTRRDGGTEGRRKSRREQMCNHKGRREVEDRGRKKMKETHSQAKEGNTHSHTPAHTHTHTHTHTLPVGSLFPFTEM